ncbi:MAG: VCBS repeat-containing protein [bacterium]|nr:VCBS repeat-containing protein [bacterium]
MAKIVLAGSPQFTTELKVEKKVLKVGYNGSPATIDWNLDGKKDIVIGDSAGYIWFYKNIGTDDSPSFNKGEKIDIGGVPFKMDGGYAVPHPCNFDAQKHYDLLIGGANGKVLVAKAINPMTENTAPVFEQAQELRANDLVISKDYSAPYLFDIDEDNLPDLFLGDKHGQVWFFKNIGRQDMPIFSEGTLTLVGSQTLDVGQYAKPVITDWNGDGKKDLICGNETGNILLFPRGTETLGTGTYIPKFLKAETIKVSGADIDIGAFASPFIVDWNNDGGKDLIVGEAYGNIRLFINTNHSPSEPPSFNASQYVDGDPEPINIGGYSKPQVIDWNNDGKKDIVVGEEFGRVALFLNSGKDEDPLFTGEFFFLEKTGTTTSEIKLKSTSPYPCDWNNDYKKDLIVGDAYGYIWVFINSGTDDAPIFNKGTYAVKSGNVPINIGYNATPCVIDYNNDGKKDLLIGDRYGDIRLFSNINTDEAPIFSEPTTILTNVGNSSSPFVIDYNKDGKKDLLVGVQDGTIWLFINQGTDKNPSFSSGKRLKLSNGQDINVGGCAAPSLCDWDKNSSLDIVAGRENGHISLYLSTFSNSLPIVTVDTPQGLQSGKVNISYTLVDEDFDTVRILPEYSRDDISWYEATAGAGGEGKEGLASSPAGKNHIFVWDSVKDIGYIQGNLTFRITPFDPSGKGETKKTDVFFVNNGLEVMLPPIQAHGENLDVGAYSAPSATLKKDLIIGDSDGYLNFFLNSGSEKNPVFTNSLRLQEKSTSTIVPIKCKSYSIPEICDYNNDGYYDILCGNQFGDIILFRNRGEQDRPPIFERKTVVSAESALDVGSNIVPRVIDWNKDNKKDILVGDKQGYLWIYLNTGTDEQPSFSTVTKVFVGTGSTPLKVSGYSAPAFIDWNGNGKEDLIVGDNEGCLWLFLNYGIDTPQFDYGTKIKVNSEEVDVGENATAFVLDYNNDGKKDILIGNKAGLVYLYQLTQGARNSQPYCQIISLTQGARTVNIAYTLYDPDGDTGKIQAEYSLDGLTWKEATGGNKENLLASTSGIQNIFSWSSDLDLPQTRTVVWFRITPFDPFIIGTSSIGSFLLNNLNYLPVVKNLKAYGNSGMIKLGFDLEDGDGEQATVTLKYDGKEGSLTGVSYFAPGQREVFWQSGINLPNTETTAMIELIPSDPSREGIRGSLTVSIKNLGISSKEITDKSEVTFSPTKIKMQEISEPIIVTVEEMDGASLPGFDRSLPGLSDTVRKIKAIKKSMPATEMTSLPATLFISYTDQFNDKTEENLAIFELRDSSWKQLKSSVDLNNNMVKADITSPGRFRIGLGSAQSLNVGLYPNPCKVKEVHFTGAPQRLKIFTITGQLVREVTGTEWKTDNQAGEEVASGMYIWLAEDSSGKTQKGIVVIIR